MQTTGCGAEAVESGPRRIFALAVIHTPDQVWRAIFTSWTLSVSVGV